MSNKEQTLSIIKPDAVQRNLSEDIKKIFTKNNLSIKDSKKIQITNKELQISKIVAGELQKKNIYFAGIDFINGKLIGDINVTSPTGLKTYYDLTGINLAEYFFNS